MNLTRALHDRGHTVTIWSTDFYHQEKRHRSGRDSVINVSDRLQIRLISSLGYDRHVGIRRLADHAQLAWKFRCLVRQLPLPDVAFVGFPPVELAAVAVRFFKRNRVPALLDIKDLWPDLFEDPLPKFARPMARVALLPLHSLAIRAIRECSGVCAPSQGFLSWARVKARTAPRSLDTIAPLTTPHRKLDTDSLERAGQYWDERGVLSHGQRRAAFAGTLSRSFDFDCIFRAAVTDAGRDWQWVICGDGDLMAECRRRAEGCPHIVLAGWVDQTQLVCLLSRSTVGLAPYRSIPNFELNVCNKVYDYLHAGLPVVSPLRGDVRMLIENHEVGTSYEPGDAQGLLHALARAATNRDRMAEAARRVYTDQFDPHTVYHRLANHLEIASQERGDPRTFVGR